MQSAPKSPRFPVSIVGGVGPISQKETYDDAYNGNGSVADTQIGDLKGQALDVDPNEFAYLFLCQYCHPSRMKCDNDDLVPHSLKDASGESHQERQLVLYRRFRMSDTRGHGEERRERESRVKRVEINSFNIWNLCLWRLAKETCATTVSN